MSAQKQQPLRWSFRRLYPTLHLNSNNKSQDLIPVMHGCGEGENFQTREYTGKHMCGEGWGRRCGGFLAHTLASLCT